MKFYIFVILTLIKSSHSIYQVKLNTNVSEVAIGLSEIINGLKPKYLIIYTEYNVYEDLDNFIYLIHNSDFKTCIFFNITEYLQYIENSILKSIESTSLIFKEPQEFVIRLQENNLAHRLSLFIFYYGTSKPPKAQTLDLNEPMRAVIITRPRKKAFKVYYNQAIPIGKSNLLLVNWYDGDSLGLYKTPLLPSSSTVYSTFEGRVLQIPAIHSPPWFYVDYNNSTENSTYCNADLNISEDSEICVIGGRDHNLLLDLAAKLNFKIQYVDPPERTQGSQLDSNLTNNEIACFSGEIGMIQNRKGHLLLGDVGLSWERRQVIEYSFFTLADSGAFGTHSPKRLNEALAVLRPFKLNVWPYLILIIAIAGPAFYLIIALPFQWNKNEPKFQYENQFNFYLEYIKEITIPNPKKHIALETKAINEMPSDLFDRCIWFTLQLFLKQSCTEPYHGLRARFLAIVYWIAATYVLADVYSAQLTSQFARPAKEAAIDTLDKLEYAMKYNGYQLFVERESSSLHILENSTETFSRLYTLMLRQVGPEGFLIDSIEEGIKKITDKSEKVILGGRETLYFNMRRYGMKNFQLSKKLFTRYSAVAVQMGCPFLDRLNIILMQLFEGGILDKLTDIEYEKMTKLLSNVKSNNNNQINDNDNIEESNSNESENKINQSNEAENSSSEPKSKINEIENDSVKPNAINLRMLQGAFIILIAGCSCAGISLCLELLHFYGILKNVAKVLRIFNKISKKIGRLILRLLKNKILNRFKLN